MASWEERRGASGSSRGGESTTGRGAGVPAASSRRSTRTAPTTATTTATTTAAGRSRSRRGEGRGVTAASGVLVGDPRPTLDGRAPVRLRPHRVESSAMEHDGGEDRGRAARGVDRHAALEGPAWQSRVLSADTCFFPVNSSPLGG